MKKTTLAFLTLLTALGAAGAQAACIYPRAPENIPDGSTATLEQMVAPQQAVKQFDADITAYNACLDMELQSLLADPNLDEARRNELSRSRRTGRPSSLRRCRGRPRCWRPPPTARGSRCGRSG